MSHSIHQELNAHLLKVYHKESRLLPGWDIILEVIQLAEMHPTFDNVRYVTWLYYAIDDLFKIVKTSWITYENVDQVAGAVTIVKHDIFRNKAGLIHSDPITFIPEALQWKELYANKSLEELNEHPVTFETNKFEYEIFEKGKGVPLEGMELISYWGNSRNILAFYKSAFKPVINHKLSPISFERFIERIEATANTSRKFDELPAVNRPEQLLKLYHMPDFATEIRETFDKKYLKVFLKDKSRLKEIQIVLTDLPSVKRVNITENNELDLTIYPNKVYSAEEMQKEVSETLTVIFASGPVNPIIKDDILIGINGQVYQKIIDLIYHFGKNLEKYKSLHAKFDEEGFREFFLPYLNAMSVSHTATGETFNKTGKTDILIQNQQGENVFIAECKVWGGEGEVTKAVDQLFERYVTWRDEKLALIIFNKTVSGFTGIIDKAISTLQKHPLFKKYNGKSQDSCASFIFRHPEDAKKEVQLELIMLNCAG